MPNYDYVCTECENTEERNVPMESREDQTCECGAPLKRKFSFKGSVWAPTATGGGHK